MNIKGRTIIITGSAQGLGRAMALAAAEKGGHLALVDLQPDALEESAELCRQAGGEARVYTANIAQEQEVETLFKNILKDFGSVDALINNAGITRDAMLLKVKDGELTSRMSLEDWQAVIDVNLTGVFLGTREAAACMVRRGTQGVIINISSISRAGNMGQSNYAAAKAGVAALTVTWAKELARYGIRVAGIAPGVIATNMTAAMKPEALEMLKSVIPLGRLGTPEEIAHTAMYILENDYFSGRLVEVDGVCRL